MWQVRWNEFVAAGANVTGFRERRWKTVQKIKPGDILLCYLTGIGRWIGITCGNQSSIFEPSPPAFAVWLMLGGAAELSGAPGGVPSGSQRKAPRRGAGLKVDRVRHLKAPVSPSP
jgi:hypothetical protein